MGEPVSSPLHITSGDSSGDTLKETGLPGETLVWHDLLYDGPRTPGWPDSETLQRRSQFIEEMTAGGLPSQEVLHTFEDQYERISMLPEEAQVVLWFDACLFDQSMLVHVLNCLNSQGVTRQVMLLCIDHFPGIEPFIGLGQLNPDQLLSCYGGRRSVSAAQFRFAGQVDRVFAEQDFEMAEILSRQKKAPIKWVPAAMRRWLQEQPDPDTGLGRLEEMALEAVRRGCRTPWDIFTHAAAAETAPQFWGDTTLWAKLNGLADRHPPLVRIDGPKTRLPQWIGEFDLENFEISPC
ncbi:MAG: DUF1835 domain-containing protein [Desulfocapsaceae bacterium]